jgi:CRISPR/Cas system Type II protein with McrA/HNH and RuvC-like nuclease domain
MIRKKLHTEPKVLGLDVSTKSIGWVLLNIKK